MVPYYTQEDAPMEIKAIQDNILCTDGDFGDPNNKSRPLLNPLGKESVKWFPLV